MQNLFHIINSKFSMTIKQYLFISSLFVICTNLLSHNYKNLIIPFREYTTNNEIKFDISNVWQFYFCRHLSNTETNRLHTEKKHYILNTQSWETTNGKNTQLFWITTYCFQTPVNKHSNHSTDIYRQDTNYVTYPNRSVTNRSLISTRNKTQNIREGYFPFNFPHRNYLSKNADNMSAVLPLSNIAQNCVSGISQNTNQNSFNKPIFREALLICFISCSFLYILGQQVVLSMIQISEKSHSIMSSISSAFIMILLINSNPEVLYQIIPNFSIKLYYQICFFSLLSIPVRIRLIKLSFPNEVNSMIEKGIYILFTLFTLVFLIFGLEFIAENRLIFIYSLFICVGYMYYVLIKVVINQREYVTIHIINLTLMTLLIVCNFLFPHQLTCHKDIYQISAVTYILIQLLTFILKAIKYNNIRTEILRKTELSYLTFRNIEEQRIKELQITNSELVMTNNEKDFVISVISHDLQNSFNVLLNFTQIFSRDSNLPEQSQNIMQMLYRAAKNGQYILENTLNWSELKFFEEFNSKQIDNLSNIFNKNTELLADWIKQKKLHIETEIDNMLIFYCNEGHLNTIIRNLISNAIKFSHNGDAIKIRNQQRNEWIQIIIQDEGTGMSPEIYKSLFSPTKTRKQIGTNGEKGTGIGLLIVKALIESNHGRIICETTMNHGTIFTVEFRLKAKDWNETNFNYRR